MISQLNTPFETTAPSCLRESKSDDEVSAVKKSDLSDLPTKPDDQDLFTFHPLKQNDDGQVEMRVEARNPSALQQTFGSPSHAINSGLMTQAMHLQTIEDAKGVLDNRAFVSAVVREIEPRDAFERLLATQMVATHVALMRQARKLAAAESAETNSAYGNCYTKLVRTYAAQMEALRKHRNGGQQTVTVQHQHVNVKNGGQAIVGHITRGEGCGKK